MTRIAWFLIGMFICLLAAGSVSAANRDGYDDVQVLRDSARIIQAGVFAPKTWEKATKAFEKARQAVVGGKNQKNVDKEVVKAREFVENAIKATMVAKLSLEQYLPPRDKAIEAKAMMLVPEIYKKAEDQFVKATAKIESGDVKGGLKEAAKSTPLFDLAEVESIRTDILGTADRLIEKALADDAAKYALTTLDKAKSARARANAIVTNDRYARTEAEAEADLAAYEARHASNLALSVRALNRNDQAWEKLMLVYEIQMDRLSKEIGLGRLPFDNGPLAAVDFLIDQMKSLQSDSRETSLRSADLSDAMVEKLQAILTGLNRTTESDDPLALIAIVGGQVEDLAADVSYLREEAQSSKKQYADLTAEHQVMTGELSTRLEREVKFKQAKSALNPSEGEVLFNSSNDVVLRLSGLSFDIGKSDIKDEHVPLLEKVKEIISLFPEAQLMIEGHTDASGDASANIQLSDKRAYAVMQYLRQSLLIPIDRIRAMGYGADKPVASNQTKDGRSKNRRIDIIIMQ